MSSETRYRLALCSYWALFVILPVALCIAVFDTGGGAAVGVGLVLVLIGERGFRPWKRLWRMDGK